MQGCTCVGMLVLKIHSDGTATCDPQTLPKQHAVPLSIVLASIICGVLGLTVLGLLAFVWFRVRRERSIKAAGPPGTPHRLQQCLLPQQTAVWSAERARPVAAHACRCCLEWRVT